MEQVKEKVAEKVGEEETTDGWTGFVQEVGEWLLGEKAETRNTVAKAIAGLISYGATTEEKLQNVADDKKGFADRLSPKGVPDAICDLLFEQYVAKSQGTKRRGSGDSEGTPDAKRQRILRRSKPDEVGKLFGCLHETQVDGAFYRFASEVLDSKEKILWIRDCYPMVYEQVWNSAIKMDDEQKPIFDPVVVTGTSGIGKSLFGIYALYRAIREMGITVVYTTYGQSKEVTRYVIAPPESRMKTFDKNDPRRLLLDLREEFPGLIGVDKMEDSGDDGDKREKESLWWGEFNKQHPLAGEFLGQLLGGTSTWVFADVQSGEVAESTPRVITLVSDNPKSFSKYIKHKDGAVLYMPIWTKEELFQVREKRRHALDEKVVQSRYDIVGGVPRSVFSENWSRVVDDLNTSIQGLTMDKLSTTLVPGSNPIVTTRLIHHVSAFPFHNVYGQKPVVQSVYASEYVRTEIYKRFLHDNQITLKMWLEYTKGIVDGKERGPQFEWFAHVVLGRLSGDNSVPVKITELMLTSRGSTEEKKLVAFATDTLLYNKLEGITELKAKQYVQPLKGNEPAIDAFCLSEGVPWEENRGSEPVLLLFQITVAAKHPMLGEPIKKIINRVRKVHEKNENGDCFDPNKHDIYLVFVVEDLLAKAEVYRRTDKQPLQEENLGHLSRIKQICLQIK